MSKAGIYLHIPFCRSRCSYCDFATGMYESGAAERYVAALTSEIAQWNEVDQPQTVDTIYFGGGTPSLLATEQLEEILNAVRDRFAITENPEITLEINPGDSGLSEQARRQTMREWRRLGINRASFGAQTFDDRELKLLGRTHDANDVRQTFADLRSAGFENINFDLIAGLPGQSLERWRQNLEAALQLKPEHLSLYLLDVHPGTPLADQIRRGMRPQPDEDLTAEMYAMMIARVCDDGYEHYEISNFCRPGFQSRHNTKYWTGATYYGFGNSAHSYDGDRRRWANERDVSKYVEMVRRGDAPVVERSLLDEKDLRSESIFLGLRVMRGINLQTYQSRFGKDLRAECDRELDRLQEAGLIETDGEALRLTTRGALLSNEVFAALA